MLVSGHVAVFDAILEIVKKRTDRENTKRFFAADDCLP
jgi:hypothetical protein